MTDEPRFVLNVNPGRRDVVHRNPREECNQDDAIDRQTIDPDTAEALVKTGQAAPCGHCNQED